MLCTSSNFISFEEKSSYWSVQFFLFFFGHHTGTAETGLITESNKTAWAVHSCICWFIILSGSRQLPRSFLLVLSTTWISKVPSDFYRDLYSLFVHKAIVFDRGGQSYIEEFDPPRRTTYLLNYFTGPVTSGQRSDGEEIEVRFKFLYQLHHDTA